VSRTACASNCRWAMNRLTQKTDAVSTTRFATYSAIGSAQRHCRVVSELDSENAGRKRTTNQRAPTSPYATLGGLTRQSFTTRDASPSDAPRNTIRIANLSTSRRSTPLYKAERGSTLMADAPLCALFSGAQRANATRASFRSTTILHSPPAWSYSPLSQRAPRLRISNRCAATTTGLSSAREARRSRVVFGVLDIGVNYAGSIHKNRSVLSGDQTGVDTAVAAKGS
jgi:hypothetical protein